MKGNVKAAVIQMDCKIGKKTENVAKMKKLFLETMERHPGTELVVFPELATSGYIKIHDIDVIDMFLAMAEPIPGPTTAEFMSLAKAYGCYIVFGMPEQSGIPGVIYNASVLIGPNGIVGVHRKVHIPIEENHYFRGGGAINVFDTELGKIGLMVCYDTSFPETARVLALKGAEIICASANWPEFVGEKSIAKTWDHFPITRAAENQVFVLASNRTGVETTQDFYGHSKIVAPDGSLLDSSEGREEAILSAELKAGEVPLLRAFIPFLWDRRPEHYGALLDRY